MDIKEIKATAQKAAKKVVKEVDHFAKLERFIAAVLVFTPAILYWADHHTFRDSISNYYFMEAGHWFGSLLTLAAALFIYNGAQHMSAQKEDDASIKRAKSRFGKYYNIIFGLALFGVLYFDHITFKWTHYIFASIFFVGCALTMILTRETGLNILGDVLGTLTLLFPGIHFLVEYVIWTDRNFLPSCGRNGLDLS
ncbi:hypothetical protein NYZ99_19450 [Maribacter litopenaei]|uniref:Tripartite tricarboxylate transporter TctB family protein n=1 Tax=Maribacter litopenaei TaxID=2976127 RepID=A0ABY5Y9G0_9FLAO|nr:hypothetical protein [Maribacter litopenaei]UWX54884.1 hypothetical protein NYZ99_19450 [Maribacter litopenaei]